MIFLLFSIGEIIWHEYVCAVISWQTIQYSLYKRQETTSLKPTEKQKYTAPAIEVIRMESEGIMASSLGDMPQRPWGSSTGRPRSIGYGRAASGSDLEDLINDILTIEK